MLAANCQMLCDSAYRVSTNDPQVHDPQEFNPVSSMTSVTLQGWFGGVVFARNVITSEDYTPEPALQSYRSHGTNRVKFLWVMNLRVICGYSVSTVTKHLAISS